MRCAVIGDPVAHSLSPAIHRAGYRRHGLDWDYQAVEVSPAGLTELVQQVLADPVWVGLSVTAPHKEKLCELAAPDDLVQLTGAANTLVAGKVPLLYNTDVGGFVQAWQERGFEQPRRAAIVGNGATARSLLAALAQLGSEQVLILARDPQRAGRLLEMGAELRIEVQAQPLAAPIPAVELLANTVPVSATKPYAAAWAASSQWLFDAVYDPWPTALAAAAVDPKTVLTGLELLAGQATQQYQLFTGKDISYDDCLAAAQDALLERRSRVRQ